MAPVPLASATCSFQERAGHHFQAPQPTTDSGPTEAPGRSRLGPGQPLLCPNPGLPGARSLGFAEPPPQDR